MGLLQHLMKTVHVEQCKCCGQTHELGVMMKCCREANKEETK
jgi:hypothetical protein